MNRNCDAAVRIDPGGVYSGSGVIVAATVGGTVRPYISFDLFNLEIIGMACTAPSAGIDKVFLRFKNNAIRSDYFAIRADSSLIAGIVGTSLRERVVGASLRLRLCLKERSPA